MRGYYGRGLNYYSKPLTHQEVLVAAIQNENRQALAGTTDFESVRLCHVCGAAMVVKGATRRGTVWRRCTGILTHDEFAQ